MRTASRYAIFELAMEVLDLLYLKEDTTDQARLSADEYAGDSHDAPGGTMPSRTGSVKERYARPSWYNKLTPEAQAEFDAIDWDAEKFLDEDETLVMPARRPPGRDRSGGA